MVTAIFTVLRKPGFALLAAAASFWLLFVAAWMRNFSFLWFLWSSPQFSLGAKLRVFVWTFDNLALNTAPLRLVLLIVAALLAGTNLAMLVFYIRKRIAVGHAGGMSVGGVLISAFGVGCASCGSVLLTSWFGFSAGAAALAALPLQGTEFSLIGIGLLLGSIVVLAKKIDSPFMCNT